MSDKTAQTIRDFITLNQYGVLSTISVKRDGYPFGSLTPYDLTASGDIIIYISLIAEHYKNLANNNKAGLFVMDSSFVNGKQADRRVSLQLNFHELSGQEADTAKENYLKRFPDSINFEIAHNFRFMRGEVESIRWIGGFGSMGWIEASEYKESSHDNVAYQAMSALQHMNEDHKDVILNYVKAFTDVDPGKRDASISLISSEGFEITLAENNSRKRLEIPFKSKLSSAEELHGVMVELAKEARSLVSSS